MIIEMNCHLQDQNSEWLVLIINDKTGHSKKPTAGKQFPRLFQIMIIFAVATSRTIAPVLRVRKVRTAQGNAPVNRRDPRKRVQIVPQKITACTGIAGLSAVRLRVKLRNAG